MAAIVFLFGGEKMFYDPSIEVITCPKKNSLAYINKIEEWMQGDRVEKATVGWGTLNGPEEALEIWEDDHYIHLGCLKESKDNFQKKYLELIKFKQEAKVSSIVSSI